MEYFVADLHLYHKNILDIDNRPEESLQEMHDNIVECWNSKIKEDDTVYVLGDVSLGNKKYKDKVVDIVKQLNGRKILIKGNHDNEEYLKDAFDEIYKYLEIELYIEGYGKVRVILFHFPILVWNKQHYGAVLIYGHLHRQDFYNGVVNAKQLKNAYCVSVGEIGYYPMTLQELVDKYGYDPIWYKDRNKNRDGNGEC